MNSSDIIQSTIEESNFVRNKLIKFNSEHVPNGRYEEINLCLKNNKGEIIAGLNSAICWNWMEVDILWVHEDYRKKGYGKQLLDEAEQISREKNCSFIKLNTFSFQAPDFYKKNGYQIIAVIENAPKDYKHYYLLKEL
ncbi:GNAT family N-acetyltransferase [Paenibacillus sp. Marseille-P2973]|uniref:GNAT family N-acetyltransferase n=1 Tax=Paenibacillus sp. Marseille-P2973 TaxID=1871032 RepID=UPI001B367AA3|nr:GNAT family N-acetyltransferase [Paenibacillus sp. Marseille-P2973]MBQ4898778.1 GNAT family N-acetyltransferase [Paenibacillus sp. Marseille-P2973]